jgi:hypothetical protein
MTDEQINVAIAEACGWVDRGSFNESRPEDHKFKRRIGNTENYEWRWQHEFNYCTDLNAMHEAEATLSVSCRMDYPTVLLRVLFELDKYTWYATGGFTHITTTARQRAEAFLRTLGKWDQSGVATEMEVQK